MIKKDYDKNKLRCPPTVHSTEYETHGSMGGSPLLEDFRSNN